MPELPEVENVCIGLSLVMNGKEINNIVLNRNRLRNDLPPMFCERLKNQKVLNVTRRGKYILVNLQNYVWIIHLGMSGKISTFEKDSYIPNKHDHVFWEINGKILAFNDPRRFGDMNISSKEISYRPIKEMGEEPFEISVDNFFQKLIKTKKPLKTALLDQKIIAGLGNIYVCEALWQSHLSPFKISNSVSKKQTEFLLFNIKEILKKAIKAGGSSLKDYRKLDNSEGGFQKYFKVYNQQEKPCPTPNCFGVIKRKIQSGRSTYFCEVCQKL